MFLKLPNFRIPVPGTPAPSLMLPRIFRLCFSVVCWPLGEMYACIESTL